MLWQKSLNLSKWLRGTSIPHLSTKAEETVAELTYQKAFEIYGNPLPDIVDLRIEKELTSILGNGFAVIYLASQLLVTVPMNGATWLVPGDLSAPVSLRP